MDAENSEYMYIVGSVGIDTAIKGSCAQSDIEMPDSPHCHMIRKTRAMDLYQSGIPLTHIQQLLGHEDLSTTSGFYAFATLDTLAKAMNKVNEEASPNKKWSSKAVMEKLLRL